MFVCLPDPPNAFQGIPVAQVAAQRVTGIGGIGDHPAGTNHFGDLFDYPGLGINRMNFNNFRHTARLQGNPAKSLCRWASR